MELWLYERQTPVMTIGLKVNETLVRCQSDYQDIAIVNTEQYGRVLMLDGVIQTTESDEFVYHEMITHIPLYAHPNPQRVLVVGGGDGGSVREICKHETVTDVVLAEIDPEVIRVAREYLPSISCGLNDERCTIEVGDGIAYMNSLKSEYDVVIIDSTDPVGPAEGLFSQQFYASVFRALKHDGIMVAQTESPFIQKELIGNVQRSVAVSFPIVDLYTAVIPTYPGGMWSFTIGSKKYDPSRPIDNRPSVSNLRYYSPAVHEAAFTLPPFVEKLMLSSKS